MNLLVLLRNFLASVYVLSPGFKNDLFDLILSSSFNRKKFITDLIPTIIAKTYNSFKTGLCMV